MSGAARVLTRMIVKDSCGAGACQPVASARLNSLPSGHLWISWPETRGAAELGYVVECVHAILRSEISRSPGYGLHLRADLRPARLRFERGEDGVQAHRVEHPQETG